MEKPLAFIVEDDPQLSRIFSIALKRDFEVETCNDGDIAVKRLDQIIPVVILLDLNLPGQNGADILKHIRSDTRLANTRILLTTANARQAELLQGDVDLVLLKPISPIQLRELSARFKPR